MGKIWNGKNPWWLHSALKPRMKNPITCRVTQEKKLIMIRTYNSIAVVEGNFDSKLFAGVLTLESLFSFTILRLLSMETWVTKILIPSLKFPIISLEPLSKPNSQTPSPNFQIWCPLPAKAKDNLAPNTPPSYRF